MESINENMEFLNSNHLEWRDPNPKSPASPQSPPPLVVQGKSLTLNRLKPIIKERNGRELSKKSRKQRLLMSQNGNLSAFKLKRRETSPDIHQLDSRLKPKREPLPMRMRALPQSFFHEPYSMQTSSLGSGSSLAPAFPSLFHNANNTGDDVSNLRPVTPPEEKFQPRPPKERKVLYSNSTSEDLLFRLFEPVVEDKTKKFVVKRGRPRRVQSDLCPSMLPKLEEDPSMVQNLANKLFPRLSVNSKRNSQASLSCVSVQDGEKSVTLPSISIEQNYSAMLSEIVAHM